VLEDLPGDAGVPPRGGCVAQLLRRHLTLHGVAIDVFEPLAVLLAAHWARYVELMVSDQGASVALMTRGGGREFTARVASVLACCEIEPGVAARMLSLTEALKHRHGFLKLTFTPGGDPRPEVSLLHRRAMSIDRGLQLLAVDSALWDDVQGCAALLRQSCVHGVALTARPGSAQLQPALRFVQVIAAQRREAVRMRLAHVASRYAPCPAAVVCWAEHHDRWLAREHVALSLWLTPGRGDAAAMRIEYPDVSVPAAAGWLEQRAREDVRARFERLCTAAGRTTLSYLEVGLHQRPVPRLDASACLACS
jgi:hypothetical protein